MDFTIGVVGVNVPFEWPSATLPSGEIVLELVSLGVPGRGLSFCASLEGNVRDKREVKESLSRRSSSKRAGSLVDWMIAAKT